MRRRRRREESRPAGAGLGSLKSEINVTPLVDVVLVLLIIFMVVTPLLARGVKIDLPETRNHEKRQDTGEQIVVSVAYDGSIFIDTDPVSDDRLADTVKEELARRSGSGASRQIHVKADRRLTYGKVKRVLERIHEAGARQVALGTEEAR